MSEQEQSNVRQGGKRWPYVVAGLVAGIVLTGLATVVAMRSVVIVRHESRLGFDDTVTALEEAVKAQGWASPGTMDLQKAMAKHGVDFPKRVKRLSCARRSMHPRCSPTTATSPR